MPIFEFECPHHGRFECILLKLPESETHFCPLVECWTPAPLVPSLPVMRPDSLWAGHYLENFGYVTSSSKVAQIQKEKHQVEIGNRDELEAMQKTAEQGAKARDEKFSTERRKLLEDKLTGAGVVDSFGQLRPEATRKLSDEEILDPAAQKRKKETITVAND